MTAVEVLPHAVDAASLVTGFALVLTATLFALGGLLALNLMRRLLGTAGDS